MNSGYNDYENWEKQSAFNRFLETERGIIVEVKITVLKGRNRLSGKIVTKVIRRL